jgi:hypothetical protein
VGTVVLFSINYFRKKTAHAHPQISLAGAFLRRFFTAAGGVCHSLVRYFRPWCRWFILNKLLSQKKREKIAPRLCAHTCELCAPLTRPRHLHHIEHGGPGLALFIPMTRFCAEEHRARVDGPPATARHLHGRTAHAVVRCDTAEGFSQPNRPEQSRAPFSILSRM